MGHRYEKKNFPGRRRLVWNILRASVLSLDTFVDVQYKFKQTGMHRDQNKCRRSSYGAKAVLGKKTFSVCHNTLASAPLLCSQEPTLNQLIPVYIHHRNFFKKRIKFFFSPSMPFYPTKEDYILELCC